MDVLEKHLQRKIQEKNCNTPTLRHYNDLVFVRFDSCTCFVDGKMGKKIIFHDTHLTDLQLRENPRSLISFQSKSFLARQMSEKVD